MTGNQKTALINRIAETPIGSVTLDGLPAVIGGFCNPFLSVGHRGQLVSFSWEAVERVLDKGGAFRS